jgi:hypothetical protein
VATAAVCVLAVLFVFNNDVSGYHYLWIVPFGLMTGHRGFVAAIALLGTGLYIELTFLAGAMFVPPYSGHGTDWLVDHRWYISAASWVVFTIWGARILLRPTPEGDASPER